MKSLKNGEAGSYHLLLIKLIQGPSDFSENV